MRRKRTERIGSATGKLLRAAGILTVVGFIALLGYGLVANAPNTTIEESLAQGQSVPAPGFELAVLEDGDLSADLEDAWQQAAADRRVALSELRGTPIVLNFWASWCDPCQEEAPVLARAAEAWEGKGVMFVGLDMQDVRADAREFVREFELDFPHVRDPTNDTARAWGATGIPETFFISADGTVVGHVIGAISAEQLNAGAQAAKTGRPLATVRGGGQRSTR